MFYELYVHLTDFVKAFVVEVDKVSTYTHLYLFIYIILYLSIISIYRSIRPSVRLSVACL